MVENLEKEIRKGGTNPAAMLLVKKGKKVLPLGSSSLEASRSSVFPLSLLAPAVSKRMAARFFSVMLGASRAGSNQAGAEEDLTLRGAIGHRCGARLERIWRFRQQGARKGIWSKARKKQ